MIRIFGTMLLVFGASTVILYGVLTKLHLSLQPAAPQPTATCTIVRADTFRVFDTETMGPLDLTVRTTAHRPCIRA